MSDRRKEELMPKCEHYDYVVKALSVVAEKIQRLIDELAEFSGTTVKAVIKEKSANSKPSKTFYLRRKPDSK